MGLFVLVGLKPLFVLFTVYLTAAFLQSNKECRVRLGNKKSLELSERSFLFKNSFTGHSNDIGSMFIIYLRLS